MARSRRNSGRRARSRTPKDWVYTDAGYAERTFQLNPGVAGILTFPLTISQNARKLISAGPLQGGLSTGAGTMPFLTSWAGIPEGGMQRVFAVDGFVTVRANTWNAGNELGLMWRLVVADQDPLDLNAFTTPGYSMTADNIGIGESVATSANQGFLREQMFWRNNIAGTAVTASGSWVLPIRWRSQRGIRIRDGNALFCYFESWSGSVVTNIRTRMRCLMASGS